MIIKEAEYKKVRVTRNQCVKEAVYGCDECGKEIADYPNEQNRLEVTVFHSDSDSTEHLHFCSWDCVLKHLPKIKTNHFISLPFVLYDADKKCKRSAQRLVDLIRTNFLKSGGKD